MLLAQLVEAVCIAGLQENQGLPFQLGCFDHVLTQVCATKAVINKPIQFLYIPNFHRF
jgi:hypothetical protein